MRRVIAPLLVATGLAAAALVITATTRSDHRLSPSAPERSRRATATSRAKATLDHAAVPPGAVAGARRIRVDDAFSSVRATQTWTTTDSIGRDRAYLTAHTPVGLTRRPHDPTIVSYSNHHDTRSLQYEFSASDTGVTIHVYAWAVWTPVRPRWSYVRGPVTSVEVTVIRKSYIPAIAAPTVRKELTGEAVRRLADLLNSLPAQRPALCHSAGPWDAHTTLLFHTDRRRLMVAIAVNCMSQAGITRPGDHRTVTLVAGLGLSDAALRAIGLPSNYGLN